MPVFEFVGAGVFAVGVAWSLGANDVANSMGTSVGSKVLTLRQALGVAGVLEFCGAVLFSQRVATRLANLVNPDLYVEQPHQLALGMLAVLIASTLWIQIATITGNPISSTHTVVGATAGFSFVAVGAEGVNWSSLGLLSCAWILTPFLSGGLSALLYALLRRSLRDQVSPFSCWQEWCPWLSALSIAIFATIVFPLLEPLHGLSALPWPNHTYALLGGAGAVLLLSLWGLRRQDLSGDQDPVVTEWEQVETQLGSLQVLSASFVAFAHGANDVGNAIAPLAVIGFIYTHNQIPTDALVIPWWMLGLGGAAIVTGLALQGKTVIKTVGSQITQIQPSSGYAAELAAATTVLLASRVGLPVSTSHALVGSVLGISLSRHEPLTRYGTVGGILSAWVLTFPVAAVLGAAVYAAFTALGL